MMNKYILACLVTLCCVSMTGCAQKESKKETKRYVVKNDKHDFLVTIKTPYGDMAAILYDETPQHKENFVKLISEHFYDSLLFHRVIKGFMIQGGDPNSKGAAAGTRLGTGGPGYTVPAEFNKNLYHIKGALSAARLGDQQNPSKASSGSQFYIVHGTTFPEDEMRIDNMQMRKGLRELLNKPEYSSLGDTLNELYQSGDMEAYQQKVVSLAPIIKEQTGINVEKDIPAEIVEKYATEGGAPHLDGQYTVFGQIISGLDVIDKIAAVETDRADRPVKDIDMVITVEEVPKKKIEKEYGYHYAESLP